MTYNESWSDKHFDLTLVIIGCTVAVAMVLISIYVLIPEKNKEITELRNMDCNTIKKHLADEEFGWMLDESRYNTQYIWRCTK